MKAKAVSHTQYILSDNGRENGTLRFDNWFSNQATLKITDDGDFRFIPVNFFRTHYQVIQNESVRFNLYRSWRGTTRIESHFSSNNEQFIMQRRGFFSAVYVLVDKDKRELITLKPEFDWRRFKRNFNIEISAAGQRKQYSLILVASMVFIARIMQRKRAARH